MASENAFIIWGLRFVAIGWCLFTCVGRLSQIHLTFCCVMHFIGQKRCYMQLLMFIYKKRSSSKQTMTMTNEQIVSTFCSHSFCHSSYSVQCGHQIMHPYKVFTNLLVRMNSVVMKSVYGNKISVHATWSRLHTVCVN